MIVWVFNLYALNIFVQLIYRIVLMNNTDGEHGRKLDDGTWTGFIGLIHEGVS